MPPTVILLLRLLADTTTLVRFFALDEDEDDLSRDGMLWTTVVRPSSLWADSGDDEWS